VLGLAAGLGTFTAYDWWWAALLAGAGILTGAGIGFGWLGPLLMVPYAATFVSPATSARDAVIYGVVVGIGTLYGIVIARRFGAPDVADGQHLPLPVAAVVALVSGAVLGGAAAIGVALGWTEPYWVPEPVLILALYTLAGLRVSEALGLTWGNLDFDTKEIRVERQLGTGGSLVPTKTTTSAMTVPLLPALERELRAHRSRMAERDLRHVHRDALVFSTTRGKPQSRRNALRAVQHAGDEVGLNGEGRETVGLHDLRHSFVAIALANGATLPEAAMLARHANPRVTLAVYAGLTDQGREVAVGKLLRAGFGA
jgi:integrase